MTADAVASKELVALRELADDVRVRVVAKAAAALADPVRLRIVQLLREQGELTVGALTAQVPVSQPRVSVHLRCLTDCGFATVRRDGRRAFYRLSGPRVVDLLDQLTGHAAASVGGLLACLSCTPDGRPTGEPGGCC
ncbi:MAG TPA: metalloregulator ArsR/SmtB family transcription factor [Pseudonocardiaceae bacterium]|jgi:DNA-binding transcriptional ArsR family regulator